MFTPLPQKKFTPLAKSRASLSFSMNALENIRKGNAQQNVEATKGLAKGLGESILSAGAHKAGPVGADMLAHAPKFAENIQGLNEGLKATNEAQVYGKGSSVPLEMALPADYGVKAVSTALKGPATRLMERAKNLVRPQPRPVQAAEQLLQKQKEPVKPKDVNAFRHIDTEGVKTYEELQGKVNKSIGELSHDVDSVLDVDPTPVSMKDLTTKTTSGSGRVVERNHVQTALDHLKELYEKTADDVGKADIEDLIDQANTKGLSRKEVNNISRMYNEEFGDKAFSKVTGDPLTSVNAQMYENIRTGLKETARKGITGQEAQETDKVISSLYGVRKLISTQADQVQKLRQKIEERGLIAKLSYKAVKALDTLSGGTIRGITDAVLNRGTGLKTLNALDLEERLGRNLKIIKDALSNGSDEALEGAINQLDNGPKAPGGAPKTETYDITRDQYDKHVRHGDAGRGIGRSVHTGQAGDFANFERQPGLSPEDKLVEDASIKKYLGNKEGLMSEYEQQFGNKTANTDLARRLFKDVGYKGKNAAAVQEAASALNKDIWRKMLGNSGPDAVLFAGSSGSGKSSAIKGVLPDAIKKAAAILDGNLSTMKSARARITEAIQAKKVPKIVYVWREPVDAWINGVVKRMNENAEEAGRIVRISTFMENLEGALNVARKLKEDGFSVAAIDNSLGPKKAKLMDAGKLETLSIPEGLRGILETKTKELLDTGKITKEEYDELIK